MITASSSILGWLSTKLREKLDWTTAFRSGTPGVTNDEMLLIWLRFLLRHGFVQFFLRDGALDGYLIARPVKKTWVFDSGIDYFATIFEYDFDSDTIWIDSIWAPGHYAAVLEALRGTQKKYVAWQHNKHMFFKEIALLSGIKPIRQEISSSERWDA